MGEKVRKMASYIVASKWFGIGGTHHQPAARGRYVFRVRS